MQLLICSYSWVPLEVTSSPAVKHKGCRNDQTNSANEAQLRVKCHYSYFTRHCLGTPHKELLQFYRSYCLTSLPPVGSCSKWAVIPQERFKGLTCPAEGPLIMWPLRGVINSWVSLSFVEIRMLLILPPHQILQGGSLEAFKASGLSGPPAFLEGFAFWLS